MNAPIILDLETQHTFREVGNNYSKLGISIVGIYDYASDKFLSYTEDILTKLFPVLESASIVIGFNIKKFDMSVLAPYYVGTIDALPILDLMDDIEKFLGFRVALDDLARETLGVHKNGHGLQAIEYFRSREFDKLREYCLYDVRITRDLYEYGKREEKIFFRQAQGRREIPVSWGKLNQAKDIPLTLPW